MAYENDKEHQRMLEDSGLKKSKAKYRMRKAVEPKEKKPKEEKKKTWGAGFIRNYLEKE